MAHPLELSYNWRPPVLSATVGVFVCLALVIRGRVNGWESTVRRFVATVALLRRGHATLFAWILAYAPQAELDRGSRKTLVELQNRGLVT